MFSVQNVIVTLHLGLVLKTNSLFRPLFYVLKGGLNSGTSVYYMLFIYSDFTNNDVNTNLQN